MLIEKCGFEFKLRSGTDPLAQTRWWWREAGEAAGGNSWTESEVGSPSIHLSFFQKLTEFFNSKQKCKGASFFWKKYHIPNTEKSMMTIFSVMKACKQQP